MSRPYRIAALIGSTSNKSRTQALVNAITKALGHQVPVDVHLVELSKLGSQFGAATRKDQLSAQALSALEQIEQADLVIAASPVYKGSYTGLFKHVIDFIDLHFGSYIYPTFNIADCGICVGVALYLWHSLRTPAVKAKP